MLYDIHIGKVITAETFISTTIQEYIEYIFKFIGWNHDYIDRINRNMCKYINYLK
jgi:hypothetical protein